MAKPKLRFPEFTDEWEEIRLKEVVNKVGSGKTPKGGATVYQNKGIMLLRSQNVQNGFLDLEDVVYISDEINQTMKNSNVKTGDLLFNITGASIGRCCIYLLTYEANVNQHVCIIRLIPNENVHFYMQYILTRQIQNQIPMLQTGGGREGLNFESVKAIKLYRPNFNEQKKLAEFLSSVDNVIQIHEQEITALEEQKKGVMQKLFNREVRFKADDGSGYPEWEKNIVKDLFNKITKKNLDGMNKNVITNSAEFGLIPQRDFFEKDIAVEGNTNGYFVISKGDFVYNPRKSSIAPYGPFNCYKFENDGIVSPLYSCLKPKYPEYINFLLWYFQSSKWHVYIYQNGAQGGARHDRVGMTNELMEGIPIDLPCLKEQQKIVNCLSTYDEIIQIKKDKLEVWKEIKKGLLQQMFV